MASSRAKTSGERSPSICLDSASMQSEDSFKPRRRDCIAFFVFGLVNNIIYVIFLSAAEEILSGSANFPKSSVLLADIIPTFVIKLISPYLVRSVSYQSMIVACVLLSGGALIVVAALDSIPLKFIGIVMASSSSGLGESAFLALTSYYDPRVIISWSSGTGAAGIVGSVYYLVLVAVLKFSLAATVLLALIWPLMLALVYAFVLSPHRELHRLVSISPAAPSTADSKKSTHSALAESPAEPSFFHRVAQIKKLLALYVAPLFLVYFLEYTINQSVFFALYYPLDQTPFSSYDDTYKTYQAIYQCGVFVSRTFGRILPVSSTWIFAILQMVLLTVFTTETLFMYLGNVYFIMGLVLIEGLLGGAAYVNTFCNISNNVPPDCKEFSMAFAGIADSTGIALAGLACIYLEPFFCARNMICKGRQP